MHSISRVLVREASQARRLASTLVVAEHANGVVSPGTLSTITAASKIGGDIAVLVLGKGVDGAAKHAATVKGVTKVLTLDDEVFATRIAENQSSAVTQLAKNYTHILAPASANGKNYIPRTAALLNSAPLSDVLAVVDENTFKRPMYAGNAIATVKMSSRNKFILVRTSAFEKAADKSGNAPIEAAKLDTPVVKSTASTFVSENAVVSARPDLTSARVVVSGGRGMKNGENFALLDKLADKLGGAVGASRAAVDAGFVPNDYQVGQTGKVVAPDLYIAVGISGAIQHLSGMKDSKVIVAVNKDKEAPIFQVADYGIVDDLFTVVPELTSKL